MKCSSDAGQVPGRPRRGHEAQVGVLDHQADRGVPPRVGAVHHAQLQLREAHADPVEVDRVLRVARDRRPGQAGVDAQRQLELAALRVEREVHRVAGRVHAVAPEARADDRVRDRVVAHEALERGAGSASARSRSWPPDAEAEPLRVGPRRTTAPASRAGCRLVSSTARSTPCSSISSSSSPSSRLVNIDCAGLEVVLLDPDHPLGLLRRRPCRCSRAGRGRADGRHRPRPVGGQRCRGVRSSTSRNGRPLFGSGSRGRPSARSPMTLRWIWSVPP